MYAGNKELIVVIRPENDGGASSTIVAEMQSNGWNFQIINVTKHEPVPFTSIPSFPCVLVLQNGKVYDVLRFTRNLNVNITNALAKTPVVPEVPAEPKLWATPAEQVAEVRRLLELTPDKITDQDSKALLLLIAGQVFRAVRFE